MGSVVVERNACDLPAICSGAFHDSILLCLVGVTKGVMAGAFEFSGKIAFYTCDGDGFQRVDITKHLDGGSIGFVSDLEGNLSGSGLFNGKTDIVEMIGVSVRFCTLAESLRGTFEAAGTEGIQCDHRTAADHFNIGFENILFSRNIADRDLIVSQVLSWRKFSVNIRKLLIILFYDEIQVKSINTLAVFVLFWLLYTA